jgi:hypothetical protein
MIQILRRAAASVPNAAINKIITFFDQDNKVKTKDSIGNIRTFVTEDASGRSSSRPYLVYDISLSQAGTAAPTATIHENTLGGVPVLSRNVLGAYHGVLNGKFPAGSVPKQTIPYYDSSNVLKYLVVSRLDDNTLLFNTVNSSFVNVEAELSANFIPVRVYTV